MSKSSIAAITFIRNSCVKHAPASFWKYYDRQSSACAFVCATDPSLPSARTVESQAARSTRQGYKGQSTSRGADSGPCLAQAFLSAVPANANRGPQRISVQSLFGRRLCRLYLCCRDYAANPDHFWNTRFFRRENGQWRCAEWQVMELSP